MCGIVGYLGNKDVKKVLLHGLSLLEYRGYDSAGVAIFHDKSIVRRRAVGKLEELKSRLIGTDFNGACGIGHTRWATHGKPSENNSHPHKVDGICIVHNGIIENYQEIRERLLRDGHMLESETDSELVAHLLHIAINQTKDLYQAVLLVVPQLKGAFAIVAIYENEPELMVAFKSGPPLIIGVGHEEMVVASDLQAVVPYTRNVRPLDDGEIAVISRDSLVIYNFKGEPCQPRLENVSWDYEVANKHGFPHYMLKEIHEQPQVVAQACRPHLQVDSMSVELSGISKDSLSGIERIYIVACGTSYYAGKTAKYIIERWSRVPVEVYVASEFRYADPIFSQNSLMIVISQSGETADTLESAKIAKQAGVPILSICNVVKSAIDKLADFNLYMKAGPEIGVASTKAFVATLTLFNLLAIFLGKIKGKINRDQEAKAVEELLALPSNMEKVLNTETFFKRAAEALGKYKGYLFLGRGVNYPIALEGALKLKEIAYIFAEGYAAGEMKHGPIAMVDEDEAVVFIAPRDELYEKIVSNIEQIAARKGKILCITQGQNDKLADLCQHIVIIPNATWSLVPILSVVPLQLLAYHVAVALGHDVDQPRNLAKSVTVE